jgi:uridine kinase
MSSNRLQYFIRNILQNSKLNRLKFVKNKKKYNDLSVNNKTNHNLIFKKKFNTSTEFQ